MGEFESAVDYTSNRSFHRATSAMKDSVEVTLRLQKAKINVRATEQFLRFSPSFFNNIDDIAGALELLS
jgi:hypothetical protein